jgi:ribosomal protein L7Ae-like RNA K-turn-binding protein
VDIIAVSCAVSYYYLETKAVIGRALGLTVQSVIAVSSHWPSTDWLKAVIGQVLRLAEGCDWPSVVIG